MCIRDRDNGHDAIPLTTADAPSMYSYDPWERMNRLVYRFNARFDESVFLPVTYGYGRLPAPIRSGVHNFFENLDEVKTIVNYAVQLQPAAGAHSLGRFLINTTLGIGGLFDVATKLKLESEPTGLSTTLSRWGMHPGPYLVIPILGPSTLRDGVGSVSYTHLDVYKRQTRRMRHLAATRSRALAERRTR